MGSRAEAPEAVVLINAAGIMFLAPGRRVLFIKRALDAPDFPGYWDFPGGGAEDDESAEQTARREAREEIGKHPNLPVALHARQVKNWVRVAAGVPSLAVAASAGAGTSLPASAPTSPPVADSNALQANVERAVRALELAERQGPVRSDESQGIALVDPAARYEDEDEDAVDFTTFAMRVERPFLVDELHPEHVAWAWAPADAPPQPLHPGCQVALDRLTMDELGVARAMAAGDLTSPQTYENVTLFDIRITGTETAYRKALDEYAYRKPENYLTPEFLARCNGLPVIMEHPRKAVLDSKEFSDRIVGTVFLPYIKGDEVWGIAKIYDVDAIRLMSSRDMSTSPSVVFRDPDVNTKMEMEDGSTLLIEGKPSLLDHIAICERGVWDKGGEPSGVARAEEREEARVDARVDAVNEEKVPVSLKNERDQLEKEMKTLKEELNKFPKGKMNLTTDEAKQLPEYKKLKAEMDKAFARLRDVNTKIVKIRSGKADSVAPPVRARFNMRKIDAVADAMVRLGARMDAMVARRDA